MSDLTVFMNPSSVAIFGASNDKTKIGGRPVRYLSEGKFGGAIYPINPKYGEVQGIRCYPTIEEIPGPVDCAIIAMPAEAVRPAVESCVRKGVKGIVLLSAGFAEAGDVGKQAQDEIVGLARAHGIRIVGPNCLGLFNTASNTFLTFSGVYEDVVGTTGRLGLVSQSGGYAGEMVKLAQHVGLNFGAWITTGNEADIEVGEVIKAFAADDNIDVILAYIEGVRNRDTLICGLELARKKRKPVIVLKSGRSVQGAMAAAAHTASLAGADTVYSSVFRRHGAYRAGSTQEMLDVAYAASRGIAPSGNRIVVLTGSGGIGVLAADFAQDEGLEVASLPEATRQKILEMIPGAGIHNPIDLTAKPAHEPELIARALDAVLSSGAADMVYLNVGVIGGIAYAEKRLVESLSEVALRYPHIPKAIGVMARTETVSRYESAGFMQYLEPARAIKSLAALNFFARAWSEKHEITQVSVNDMPKVQCGGKLSEADAKKILNDAGVRTPEEYLVKTRSEADAAAIQINSDVAIKVVSPDLLHKTEVGGVALDVAPTEAGARLEEMRISILRNAPEAEIEGFLITPMIDGGVECFIGTQIDPVFGVTLTFGLGGITVELFKDVTTRILPIDKPEAMEMIDSVQSAPLLNGYRGRPKADIDALADVIVKIAALAQANSNTVHTIEINPLLVLEEGHGVVALDAVIAA